MSDLRPDDMDTSERSSLPPDLLPIHDRLTGDGARWRHRAPAGAGLGDWARVTLADEAGPRARRHRATDQPGLQGWFAEHLEVDTTPPTGPRGPIHTMTMTRLRGFIGVAAAVLVVGLIALLLTHNAANRGGPGAGATATPQPRGTPQPNGTPQQQAAQTAQPEQLPVVAPSDAKIAYVIANNAFMRSSDGGKTYATEALPKTDLTQIDAMSVAVSPLDANHVFVVMSGKKGDQGCLPPTNSYPALATHGGVLASGYVPCAEQYMSVDGGHTWSQPTLPTKGVLGALNMFRAVQGPYAAPSYTFQVQGQRLYSAMAFDNMGGSLVDSQGARLVASDDGGLTWRFVDRGLATSNRFVCDFGAAPTPSILYAVTGDQACGNEVYPNLSLWRSDNGGQSWSRIRALPSLAEAGLFVGAHGEVYIYMPQLTVQGHGSSLTNSLAAAMVSYDGGVTFSSAPSVGVPPKDTPVSAYATLADGSVVYGMYTPPTLVSGPQSLYIWKKGATSWTKIGGVFPNGVAAVVVSPLATGVTQQSISIIDCDGHVSTLSVPLSQ